MKQYNIAVAGTGYVGLSIATLLAQHNHVTAVDIIPNKVELINNKKSPIQDEYIEKYLAEKELDLTATLDAKEAYSDADFVVIADRQTTIARKTFLTPNCYSGRQGSLQRCGLRRYCRSYQLRPGEELLRHPSYRRCDRPRHQRKSGCGNDHQINHPRGLYPFTLYKICTTIPSQSGTGRQEIQPALFSGIFA